MALLHLSESNFKQEILQSNLPALVDFSATWCGPCKLIAPILEDLAREYQHKLKIGKIDVEEAPRIVTQYGVMSVPTLIFFKNGKVMEQVVGALNKTELKKKIEANI